MREVKIGTQAVYCKDMLLTTGRVPRESRDLGLWLLTIQMEFGPSCAMRQVGGNVPMIHSLPENQHFHQRVSAGVKTIAPSVWVQIPKVSGEMDLNILHYEARWVQF